MTPADSAEERVGEEPAQDPLARADEHGDALLDEELEDVVQVQPDGVQPAVLEDFPALDSPPQVHTRSGRLSKKPRRFAHLMSFGIASPPFSR